MTQSDWESPPPDPPFTCLRCHDRIDEDDSERYAGLCEGCYDQTGADMDEWGWRIFSDMRQRLKETNSATGAREE